MWSVIMLSIDNTIVDLQPNALLGRNLAVASILTSHQQGLMKGIVWLAFLLLHRVLFRRTWLATGAFSIFMTLVWTFGMSDDRMVWFVNLLYFASVAVLYLRFGLVSAICGVSAFFALSGVPLTANFFAWYSEPGKIALGAVLIVAGFGFYTSTLAGRSLFGAADLKAI